MALYATTCTSDVQIEAVQSVMPLKPTERQFRAVNVSGNVRQVIFKKFFHVILYYNKTSDDDSGWMVAGWMKESLGQTLSDQPMICGRLRGSGEELELVSNESGVRLVETKIEMELKEFLDAKDKSDDAETRLVFCEDLDERNPQYSPLFFVQVTNFKCGGYSIGLSCSLLVEDPFSLTSFLNLWVGNHNTIVSKSERPKVPIFYLPKLDTTGSSTTNAPHLSNPSKHNSQTFVFKFSSSENLCMDYEMNRLIASVCIEESAQKVGKKVPSMFCLLVKEVSGGITVENVTMDREIVKPKSIMSGLAIESWDILKLNEIHFYEGNTPIGASYWINSTRDESLAMVISSPDNDAPALKIVVTIPT